MPEYYGAVVCQNGHVLSRMLRSGERPDPRCGKCGSNTITHCPSCDNAIRGARSDVPGGGPDNVRDHCWQCGSPYPWRQKQIADAEDVLALQIEVNDWDEATQDRLREITAEIVDGSANPDKVMLVARWLDQHAGDTARQALWEVIKTAGAEALIGLFKATYHLP